jgi:hypothetical protein
MKKSELKVGMMVTDRWFPDWGTGKVIKIMKTRVKIDFNGRIILTDFDSVKCKPRTYDYDHVQFLEKV